MATIVSNLFYLFLASLTLIFVAVAGLDSIYDKPGPSTNDQLLVINKGQSVSNIAIQLTELNLIENRIAFMLVLRFKGVHDKIKFGQYMIPKNSSIKEIVEQMVQHIQRNLKYIDITIMFLSCFIFARTFSIIFNGLSYSIFIPIALIPEYIALPVLIYIRKKIL